MITIVRAPLRVSFFGGGTDYPEYFERRRSAVVGMAIDRYIYISALRLPSILTYRYRIAYSKLEQVHDISEIEHPVIRTVLQMFEFDEPLDISITSEVPANTGLGSSSAFTVAFIKLVASLKGLDLTKIDLARFAIHVERERLKEVVGVQDQHHAAFGGINRFDFTKKRVQISPLQISAAALNRLSQSFFLIYTGIRRHASATLTEQIERTKSSLVDAELDNMLTLVDSAVDLLEQTPAERICEAFGDLLHQGWLVKKRLSSKVSSGEIDQLYEKSLAAGAIGGKLCGAGAGGFLFMIVPPEKREAFLQAMAPSVCMPVSVDTAGAIAIRS